MGQQLVVYFLEILTVGEQSNAHWEKFRHVKYIRLQRAAYRHVSYKVKQSRNRPGVAQRVPGGLGSQISWHSTHECGEVSLTHRQPLPQEMFMVLIFTRDWVRRKEYVTEKSSDTTGNRSLDRPTSSAAPLPLRHPRKLQMRSIMFQCLCD